MDASIFISFASQDRKVASTLCKALESRGFKCWLSSRDILPGENFQVAIVRAIRKAKILLLVFTANSNGSEEMTKELALASQEKLIVVPLRIEDVAPSEAFTYEFATRQWIDFFADWEAAIDQLSERLALALPSEGPALAAAAGARSVMEPAAAPAVAPAAAKPPAPKPAAPVLAPEPPPAEAAAAEVVGAEAMTAVAEPEAPTPVAAPRPAAPPARPKPAPAASPAPEPDLAARPEAAPPRRRVGVYAAVAAAVLALVVAGLAAPGLFAKKPDPKEKLAAVAIAAPGSAGAPAPVEAKALSDSAVAALTAEGRPVAEGAATDAAAEEAAEPVKPKPKRKAAPKKVVEDIPY